MPYFLSLLDNECTAAYTPTSSTFTLTVGSSFQPGDLRLVYMMLNSTATASTFPGWTKSFDVTGPVAGRILVFTQVMTGSSVNGTLTTSAATGTFLYAATTIRNPLVTQSFTCTNASAAAASRSTVPCSSVTGTANGILLNFVACWGSTAGTLSVDASMTNIGTATTSNGPSFLVEDMFAAENYAAAGATGAKSFPVAPTASYAYQTSSLYLQQNPIGKAPPAKVITYASGQRASTY